MLSHRLLRNHAGLVLIGDYGTLRLLHEIVHDVNERSPLVRDKEGPFLTMAYEVRKAYEGQREVVQPPEHFEEIGVRYGGPFLWPVLLLQHRILRESLAWIDHGKKHQAIAYVLEAVIEEAIAGDFGTRGPAVADAWRRLDPTHPDVCNRLHTRGALFCSWTKAERRRLLPDLLNSFDPLFDMRSTAFPSVGKSGLSPSDFAVWDGYEWPDPRM